MPLNEDADGEILLVGLELPKEDIMDPDEASEANCCWYR